MKTPLTQDGFEVATIFLHRRQQAEAHAQERNSAVLDSSLFRRKAASAMQSG
jgi:hypothetical protein